MKETSETTIQRRAVRSLPIEFWPSAERAAWAGACRPNVRLTRGGAASHLRPVTRNDLAKRNGLFLDSLLRSGRLDMQAGAGAQVTPDNADAYVAELKSRVSSVAVYGSIQKLRRFVQLVAPHRDLDWLIAIERQLFSEMRPRAKWNRVVTAEALSNAGLTLMTEAEMAKRPKLTRARMFRNGLMIALKAHCPIRLKNFAALEIGRSFVNVDGTWWIVLTAAETKEKREDERPVPEELTTFIKRYLEIYRPILARGNTVSNALWMAMNGKPMSYASMGELITETTRITIGVKVNPHLFRTAPRTWTTDLKARRIRVNAVSPGSTDTPGLSDLLASSEVGEERKKMIANAVPLGRFGTPDEIAKAVVFLASDDASYITGTELFVDGGFAQV